MGEVQMDLISAERLENMPSTEKIQLILDKVKNGKIVVLETGLTPEEEIRLIERTMTEIRVDEFSGIEIESYPAKKRGSFIGKIMGKTDMVCRMTIVGPANQIRTTGKDRYEISTKVSIGDGD